MGWTTEPIIAALAHLTFIEFGATPFSSFLGPKFPSPSLPNAPNFVSNSGGSTLLGNVPFTCSVGSTRLWSARQKFVWKDQSWEIQYIVYKPMLTLANGNAVHD